MRLTSTVIIFFLSCSIFSNAMGDEGYKQNKRTTTIIKSDVVTGFNRLMGNPIWDLGPELGLFGFETVGVHQPGASEAAIFEPWLPKSTLLATRVDPVFLGLFGLSPDVVPVEQLNLPLRDVPVIIGPAGMELSSLPSIEEAGMLEYSRATPSGDITLGNWLNASGKAKFICNNGKSDLVLLMKKLIPNALYSVSGVFLTDAGPVSLPLGGVPNAFTTNNKGVARFNRKLNFCIDDENNTGKLLVIDVSFHSNHALYGTQTNLPFAGAFAGVVNHIHLSFLVNGEPL